MAKWIGTLILSIASCATATAQGSQSADNISFDAVSALTVGDSGTYQAASVAITPSLTDAGALRLDVRLTFPAPSGYYIGAIRVAGRIGSISLEGIGGLTCERFSGDAANPCSSSFLDYVSPGTPDLLTGEPTEVIIQFADEPRPFLAGYQFSILIGPPCQITIQGRDTVAALPPKKWRDLNKIPDPDFWGEVLDRQVHSHPGSAEEFWRITGIREPNAAAQMEILRPRIERLVADVVTLGGQMQVVSLFRPRRYQEHFVDIRYKSRQLIRLLSYWRAATFTPDLLVGKLPNLAACKAVSNAVGNEATVHGLWGAIRTVEVPNVETFELPLPVVCSKHPCPHTRGVAADAWWSPRTEMRAIVDEQAMAPPRLFRDVRGDPTHFSLEPNPGLAHVQVTGHSPIALLVTDPLGRRIGFDAASQTLVNEIGDDAWYSDHFAEPQVVDFEAPVEGVYSINAIGVGSGSFSVTLDQADTDGAIVSTRIAAGTAAPGVPIEGVFITLSVDREPPIITVPGDLIVPATDAQGAMVTFSVTANDNVDTSVTLVCTPPSGSIFTIGTTIVSCTATDDAQNQTMSSFNVMVRPFIKTPDGRLFGTGLVVSGVHCQIFAFRVSRLDNRNYGRFECWAKEPSRTRWHEEAGPDFDGEHDHNYGRDHRTSLSHFEATSITSVIFVDDPASRPGPWFGHRPFVDTVTFTGIGKWNGKPGYTFEVVATDKGEPGPHRDTLSLVVKDSKGVTVASANHTLDGGNIQSTSLRR